jgi:N-succinyldiaminopimelate aminotransferase
MHPLPGTIGLVGAADAYLATRLRPFTTTIFSTMSELAVATGSVNLGQGFPDTDGPDELKEVAIDAIRSRHNQYPPGGGLPELRQAVAAHQREHYGLQVSPDDEVLVTVGATEAIAAAMLALCEPGDEVVAFEPSYDSYAACAAMAGAGLRLVRLHAPDWSFDPADLAAAVGPRTRLVLLNSPHNPTGKVFSPDELSQVAALCVDHDILAVTDEVYEHLVFDGTHLPLACLPGMASRTLTISSGGKTFSLTGWKVGWASGPAPLVGAVRSAKQFLTYTSPAAFQLAIARGLESPPESLGARAAELAFKRDLVCDGLERLGHTVYRPAATYFATTDIAGVAPGMSGVDYCLALPGRCGVVAIPSSVFYDPGDPEAGATLVRWAFCKREDVLRDALSRLASWTS